MAEPQTVIIDGNQYDISDISERCKSMLAAAQNGQQGISMMSAALDMARAGLDQTLADAKKLLPEPMGAAAEESQFEEVEAPADAH